MRDRQKWQGFVYSWWDNEVKNLPIVPKQYVQG